MRNFRVSFSCFLRMYPPVCYGLLFCGKLGQRSLFLRCFWPSIPSKCGNTEMMFDVKNVGRDNREKESEISSTPTTSSRVLVLTASCKSGDTGVNVVTVALVYSLFISWRARSLAFREHRRTARYSTGTSCHLLLTKQSCET